MKREWWFFRVMALTVGDVLVLYLLAWGQTPPPTVDLTKAKFVWTWTQEAGGPVDRWIVRCGHASKSYTILYKLPTPTARTLMVNEVVKEGGQWFCEIAAANDAGVSLPSPEVSFTVGQAPVGRLTFSVATQ